MRYRGCLDRVGAPQRRPLYNPKVVSIPRPSKSKRALSQYRQGARGGASSNVDRGATEKDSLLKNSCLK